MKRPKCPDVDECEVRLLAVRRIPLPRREHRSLRAPTLYTIRPSSARRQSKPSLALCAPDALGGSTSASSCFAILKKSGPGVSGKLVGVYMFAICVMMGQKSS